MKTQELKSYIDRVLGNNIRCLLPSYWWKRLFNAVIDKVDEKVEKSELKTINGESIVGEGNLKVGVTTVGSIDELNALEAEVGDIATATREAEKFVGVGTLLQYEDGVDYNSLFKVKKVSISVPKTSIGELSLVHLSTREGNITLTIVCSADGKDGYIQAWYEDGRKVDLMREQTLVQSNIDDLNSYLSKNVVRYISAGASSGSHFEFIDTWFKVATPYTVADAYIKSYSWEKLSKEYVVSSEEELNALSVKSGTIAKVARGGLTLVGVNDLFLSYDVQSNWDKYTVIKRIERKSEEFVSGTGSKIILYDGETPLEIICHSNFTYAVQTKDGVETEIYLGEINQLLLQKDFRCVYCTGLELIGSHYNLYKLIPASADAYIKGETWTRLLKEGDVTGGGADITIDSELSDTSENPVQNKVITAELDYFAEQVADAINSKADASAVETINTRLSEVLPTVADKTYVDSAISAAITNTLNTEV